MAPTTRSRAKAGSPVRSAKAKATKNATPAPKKKANKPKGEPKAKATATAQKNRKAKKATTPQKAASPVNSPPKARVVTPEISKKTKATPSKKKKNGKGKEPLDALFDELFGKDPTASSDAFPSASSSDKFFTDLLGDTAAQDNTIENFLNTQRNAVGMGDGPSELAARQLNELENLYNPFNWGNGGLQPQFRPGNDTGLDLNMPGPAARGRGPMPEDFSLTEGRGGNIIRYRRANADSPSLRAHPGTDGPTAEVVADFIPLESPSRAGRGARSPAVPNFAPVNSNGRPTYAPVNHNQQPRRRSARSSAASPSPRYPPPPLPPMRRRSSPRTPTHRPARRPNRPAPAMNQAFRAPRQRQAPADLADPFQPQPRRPQRPVRSPTISPITPRPLQPRLSRSRSPLANLNTTPEEQIHSEQRQVRFRQPVVLNPITPRRFQEELRRLQARLVTDPGEVNAIRRSQAERRRARDERTKRREVERERARVDARQASIGGRRGGGRGGQGLGVIGI